jgi:MFS family permease
MTAGEATVVVALADTFFFDVDLTAARSRILLFLLVSFTPFLVISPLIGPFIDRLRGGRRLVIQGVAVARIALQFAMMLLIDSVLLFPLVFAVLVLQKTYIVSKSALVPSVVRTETELIEANSKLGIIAGITGAIAVVPAVLLQVTIGPVATLFYGAVYFVLALGGAVKLPREVSGGQPRRSRRRPKISPEVAIASNIMMVLRGAVGFVLFQLAFWFRSLDEATIWFGLVIAGSALGTMIGNLAAPRLRALFDEERLLTGALLVPITAGILAALLLGRVVAVLVAVAIGFAAAVARLAFESIVQRDVSPLDRGRLFARFETRFQLAWVGAGILPVVVALPGRIGFILLAALGLVGLVRDGRRLTQFRPR